jgi:hypothetical protein
VARQVPFKKEDPVMQAEQVVSLQTEQLACRQAMQMFEDDVYVPTGQLR